MAHLTYEVKDPYQSHVCILLDVKLDIYTGEHGSVLRGARFQREGRGLKREGNRRGSVSSLWKGGTLSRPSFLVVNHVERVREAC